MRDCGTRPAGFGTVRPFTGGKPQYPPDALRKIRAGKMRTGWLFCHHAQDLTIAAKYRIP